MTTPRVRFRAMQDGTAADFELISTNDDATATELPDRIMEHLRLMADDDGAYQIDRLQHVLQTATRAERDGADDDWIVGCLLHDIGDVLAPFTHGEVAAEIVRPFVRDEVTWAVQHHGIFQRFYNRSLTDEQRAARERFHDHPHYDATIRFCERWDQCSFDPDYDTEPLAHFESVLRRVFTRAPFDHSDRATPSA